MKQQIEFFVDQIKQKLADLRDPKTIEKWELEILGRKGAFHKLIKDIKKLPEKERPIIGKFANEAKGALKELFQEAIALPKRGVVNRLPFDVTQPGIAPTGQLGHRHPLSIVKQELAEIFLSMNYQVVEGPELDTEWYVFEALNIPPTHPARDIQDTFFVNRPGAQGRKNNSVDRWVMRTHTSNMQVHVMETMKPPLRCVAIGRCFRNEATDASHEHTFYQIEGFAVDKEISIANLLSTLKGMLETFFQRKVKVRLRPGYFPFVEPGFELDCSCVLCSGKGCSVCKHSGWIEMLGCGLIHPNVFKAVGYPASEYSGFAFGMGIERLAMLRYGVKDIRLFQSADLRFLTQFE